MLPGFEEPPFCYPALEAGLLKPADERVDAALRVLPEVEPARVRPLNLSDCLTTFSQTSEDSFSAGWLAG